MGYRGKVKERNQARRLRAKGWTMPDIAAKLGVSKSSVSLWTHDVSFQPRMWRRPPGRRGPNKLQRAKQAEIDELLAEGRDRISELTEKEFLVVGVALYAGERAKTEGAVKFVNSDPKLMTFFCAWLRYFFEVDESRLRVRLYLHEGLDLEVATAHWAAVTRVPPTQFTKPYRAKPDPSIRHAKHPMGCATLTYSCSRTHRALMGLVRALLSCDLVIPG